MTKSIWVIVIQHNSTVFFKPNDLDAKYDSITHNFFKFMSKCRTFYSDKHFYLKCKSTLMLLEVKKTLVHILCVNYCVYLESNSKLILGRSVSQNEIYHQDMLPLNILSSNHFLHHIRWLWWTTTSHLNHGTLKPELTLEQVCYEHF